MFLPTLGHLKLLLLLLWKRRPIPLAPRSTDLSLLRRRRRRQPVSPIIMMMSLRGSLVMLRGFIPEDAECEIGDCYGSKDEDDGEDLCRFLSADSFQPKEER